MFLVSNEGKEQAATPVLGADRLLVFHSRVDEGELIRLLVLLPT